MVWNGVLERGANPIPGYELLRVCGRGAFAEVWQAQSPFGQEVALKVVQVTDAAEAVREVRAIRTISKMPHRRLIRIDQVWAVPGYVIVAMELAQGSLMDVLDAYREECRSPVPITHLLPFMRHSAEAIDFLNLRQHQTDRLRVSFQHCDIKPSNLLLVDGRVKLADFGLTTPMSASFGNRPRCGTPAYAAPEVFQGQLSDRTDQYALAITYFHLRTGRLPFPVPASDLRPSSFVKPDVSALNNQERFIVERALRTAPSDRWMNCTTFVQALEAAITNETLVDRGGSITDSFLGGLSDTVLD
ncbi:serine/threonine-protein kinase [Tuwongella immobilis]|uniref:non-specific serine/threonine protein kinase n=1 Tax=Tuwongella immobilis TaxID=692036 RepID=A0A6C2YTN2_9BACT|nr:serine/threonine-protein kinase [Tuwongella immobilis]VIP04275.1 serine threonine protein kinase : Serine/threonine protein kinase OS=Singulisphaera acidiphila (strain ATCC BAA-1392 / DSM 18658 / VKM B-2454 / MOB10) GN=Sinac_0241 PE=4 SV=1: Pkinase [Tuwongella immobilis]VTS05913.1 serine threonine protein kinase : Serine/threonine protein kinase OS=Singulisphaera acidiphila (strain ATCC BAA-1392 / DSM 18658 / VKM B-2454 / MOB10) GN=Sinac_0241 PE=4 SV=1: Pkinase [Tuwongella immobilis]